ncbi:MAG TPA: SDR family NAD(P)-dependent oxidoreductase [Solirubrobacteraceae bacterium]
MSPRGRIVIGTLGLDQHEVGAMAVAQLLMRNGFEVVYLGRFNTPDKLARVAEQEDADVVGVSVHSWELATYAADLVEACHAAGAAVVIGGSVLTADDEASLARAGVDATFGPYAPEETIIARIDELVGRARAGELGEAPAAGERGALLGKVVAVTGAARGLGRAYAERLTREGAAVVGNDLDAELLDELVAGSSMLAAVPGDVAEPDTARALVSAALERFGRLDAVIANAGLLRSGPLVKLDAEDFDLVQAVHVRGTFLLLQAAARYWRSEAKAGRPPAAAAVTTTSSAGLYGFLGEAAYSAAKAAIAAMTVVAAEELARYDVTVNAIAPVARTRLTAWMGEGGDDADDPYAPAHVAPAAAWLVSDRARDITGRVFEVGGDVLAVADGWRPTATAALPRDGAVSGVGVLIERLVAEAPAPHPVQRADATALVSL